MKLIQQYFGMYIVRILMILFWVAAILSIYQLPNYLSLLSDRKTLYVLSWPLLIDAQYLVDFGKKTGIRIKVSYFETAEELLSKLKATGGAGYDIIFPSDHTIEPLIKAGLLHKIDKTRLDFLPYLDERLLHDYYDPDDDYSIPFFWACYGIGYNKNIYGENPPETFGLIFDKQYNPQHVLMTSSAREAIFATALYQFGSIEALKDLKAQKKVKNILLQQKEWVDIYSEERVDELLASENVNIAFGLSTDITRGSRSNPAVKFMLPKEGSFKIIDAVAIPKKSANVELAYKFINYLYQPEVMDHHIEIYNMCSPIINTGIKPSYCPSEEEFKTLCFIIDVVSGEQITDIWIDLLAS